MPSMHASATRWRCKATSRRRTGNLPPHTTSTERPMGMLTEFREFAMRGNVIDLAVGVVIGGAFGKIVTALVDKVIMPPIGLLIGGVDFSKLAITLKAASVDAAGQEVPAVVLAYGEFINAVVQFVIVAFAIFIV